MTVAIKNKKGKEDKKDYYFYSVGTRAVGGADDQVASGQVASIDCSGCDDSMDVLYGLLTKIRAQ